MHTQTLDLCKPFCHMTCSIVGVIHTYRHTYIDTYIHRYTYIYTCRQSISASAFTTSHCTYCSTASATRTLRSSGSQPRKIPCRYVYVCVYECTSILQFTSLGSLLHKLFIPMLVCFCAVNMHVHRSRHPGV